MQRLTGNALVQWMQERLPLSRSTQVHIAYSGGVDSTVLLHAIASSKAFPVAVLHCDHGLQDDSENWVEHCADVCNQLEVPFKSKQLSLGGETKHVDEQTARQERYQWMKKQIKSGEALLTAHHQSDQAETFILNLMRGAGVRGLSAIQPVSKFGKGYLVRPLLPFSKESILSYAYKHRLSYIEDPSNQDTRYDRNFIRHKVVPALAGRWPSAGYSVAQSAENLSSCRRLLDELGAIDLSACAVSPSSSFAQGVQLNVIPLQDLSEERQINLLRYWIRNAFLPEPGRYMLENFLETVVGGKTNSGEMVWHGICIHRFRDTLYLVPQFTVPDSEWQTTWDLQSPLAIKNPGITLTPKSVVGQGLNRTATEQSVTVCFRSGGEKIRLPGRTHSRTLKNLFREHGIPPWERILLPLIYCGQELAAVPPYFIAGKYLATNGEPGIEVTVKLDSP